MSLRCACAGSGIHFDSIARRVWSCLVLPGLGLGLVWSGYFARAAIDDAGNHAGYVECIHLYLLPRSRYPGAASRVDKAGGR
jgi:hypothetical protein